jgi:hypothetical protein
MENPSLRETIASSVIEKKPLKIDKEKIPNQRQILTGKPIMLFSDTTMWQLCQMEHRQAKLFKTGNSPNGLETPPFDFCAGANSTLP